MVTVPPPSRIRASRAVSLRDWQPLAGDQARVPGSGRPGRQSLARVRFERESRARAPLAQPVTVACGETASLEALLASSPGTWSEAAFLCLRAQDLAGGHYSRPGRPTGPAGRPVSESSAPRKRTQG